MNIIILGMGCPRCQKLAANAEAAAKHLKLTFTLEEITDRERIERDYQGPALPALVLDGRVVSAGQILEAEAIEKLMQNAEEAARVFDVTKPTKPEVSPTRRLLAFGVLALLVVLAVMLAMSREPQAQETPQTAPSVASSVTPLVVSELK